MPFTGDTFNNVTGATTAAPGDVVQSAVWNAIHSDYATALTMIMSQMTTMISNRNILYMNGGMEVWQRGAGASASIAVAASTTAYTADRWYIITGVNQASVVAAVTTIINGSRISGKITRNAAQTGTGLMTFGYPLEVEEVVKLRGRKVTATITVQAGAGWSPASGTLNVIFAVGTGGAAKRGAGFPSETVLINSANNLTPGGAVTTIQVSSTVVVPTNTTGGEFQLTWTPVGTAGAADEITIDDVQVEAQLSDDIWTPCTYDRLSFPEMLQACQRHYNKTFNYSRAPAQNIGLLEGDIEITVPAIGTFSIYWQFPSRMRTPLAAASITTYSPAAASANWWVANAASTGPTASINAIGAYSSDLGTFIQGTTVTAANNTYAIHITASAGI